MKFTFCIACFLLISLTPFYSQTIGKVLESDNESAFSNKNLSDDDQINYVLISFGEKLNSTILSISDIEEFSWNITRGDSFNIQGKGKQLIDVLFEIPGEYNVELNHTERTNTKACQHANEKIAFRLKVLNEKYELLFEELTLSKTLFGNVESKGVILSLPIIYSNYYNKVGNVDGFKMISSGVNTSIIGEVMNKEIPLQSGKNVISFSLSGKATSNTYIMFDFYKHDKFLQTYYLPTLIK
jgi:hypothetical protein